MEPQLLGSIGEKKNSNYRKKCTCISKWGRDISPSYQKFDLTNRRSSYRDFTVVPGVLDVFSIGARHTKISRLSL